SNSILEEALNCGIPNSSLKWHYRSSHESLISFSNKSFYDSQLATFPSVETEVNESGLYFEFVPDGIYEGKGVNILEARRVAEAVVKHAKTTPHISLGVGTFSAGQQLAIQDELEHRRRQDSSLEAFFDRNKKDPFFVKNLENIQGDERDVIFLSVAYAKALDGKLRYNFGPLNGEHGWRRMNVLTTRAKNLMYVFSSIKAEDINLLTTNSRGAKLLRDFLKFAENKELEISITPQIIETESAFEKEVYRELTKRGLILVPKVGISDYRIDFGVLDEQVKGKYICGIECDGISYFSAQNACDRDHLRQKALKQRGWEIHRVWSTDWFKDRNGQIERLLKLIDDSRNRARSEQPKTIEKEFIVENLTERLVVPKNTITSHFRTGLDSNYERFASLQVRTDNSLNFKVKTEVPSKPNLQIVGKSTINYDFNKYIRPVAKPYQTAKIEKNYSTQPLVEASVEDISKVIKTVVEVESPIYIKDLLLRTASVWGEKAGSNSARMTEIIKFLAKSGGLEITNDFVYQIGGKIEVRFRKGVDVSSENISPEEIIEAVFQILNTGHKFSKNNLINETRTVFGITRTKVKLQQTIETIINDLLTNKVIYEDERGVGLVIDAKRKTATIAA
ncbi:MAG TPA: AAA domain-containing protein, partial [Pyrinomonadaceae bacterium]|nr:AAA domain-containing protein [Pyrinomonadaceae bacterium]